MKFKTVLPIILITQIWSMYLGVRQGMSFFLSIFYGLGGVLFAFGVPYAIAVLTIKTTVEDYQKKRFNRLIVFWCILIFCQLIVQLNAK